MKKIYKILICAGGTGGHIYTGITIANSIKKLIKKNNYSVKFLFIGKKNGMEISLVSKSGYDILGLWISGFPTKILTRKILYFPIKIIHSYIKCFNILKNFSPNIVIGTGGYVSGIPLYLSCNSNIPTFIHEQNIIPGFTNQTISNYNVKKVFVAYKETVKFFPKNKTIITGNPVRDCIKKVSYISKIKYYDKFHLDPKYPIIFSIGGSQGANSINNFWLKYIKVLLEKNIQLIWQIGTHDFHNIVNNPICNHPNISLNKFINNINTAYSISNIVISRAGAMTISELAILGKPSILVPLPKSIRNHQIKNAEFLAKKNAAIMIYNEEIDKKLIYIILNLIENKKLQKILSKNIRYLKNKNSSYNIAKEIINSL